MNNDHKDKKEVSGFRAKYISNRGSSKVAILTLTNNQQPFVQLIDMLMQSNDFERPDGYYFDKSTLTLYIFEHFAFDCSPMNRNGSSLRRNTKKVNQAVEREVESSTTNYESEKVIEQGYSEEKGNTITYHMGADGDKYRNNYIASFKKFYEDHNGKVKEYIENCKNELGVTPQKVVISFLVEDVTVFGTHYKTNDNIGEPVILLRTKQFLEIFRNSSVDYVFFGISDNRYLAICDRSILNDDPSKYVDLLNEEFYIIPAALLFTFAIKH
ncbi:MAG: hypothetical protein J1F33_01200 [Clostridiales bacterium]|nr:hypothetical protein [Clostridiales bacterium]